MFVFAISLGRWTYSLSPSHVFGDVLGPKTGVAFLEPLFFRSFMAIAIISSLACVFSIVIGFMLLVAPKNGTGATPVTKINSVSRILLRILQILVGLAAAYILIVNGIEGGMSGSGDSIGTTLLIGGVCGGIAYVPIWIMQIGIERLKTLEEKANKALKMARHLIAASKRFDSSPSRAEEFRKKAVILAIEKVVTNYPETPQAAEAIQLLQSLEPPA